MALRFFIPSTNADEPPQETTQVQACPTLDAPAHPNRRSRIPSNGGTDLGRITPIRHDLGSQDASRDPLDGHRFPG